MDSGLGVPEGLKWGWLNSVSLILRVGTADVNSCAKSVTSPGVPVIERRGPAATTSPSDAPGVTFAAAS